MFYQYAVEPQAIASSWDSCRYLSEKFGFDRARVLAQYPGDWFTLARNAASGLPDVEKKKIVERLVELKRRAAIRCNCVYEKRHGDWLANAIIQRPAAPFRAILAAANPNLDEHVVTTADVSEDHPLIAAPHDIEVARDAGSLAAAMAMLLKSASRVLFVDPYYDPFNARYQNTLRECLRLVQAGNPNAVCEIHHLDGKKSPPVDAIEKNAKQKFNAVIPKGMTVTIYRWRQKDGGADFHARYLLTDRGGIRIDAGLSAEGGGQKTDMSVMDFGLSQAKRASLGRDAKVYELVEPVLQIAPSGYVEHV